jgi:hypothetical protein
VRNEFNLPPLNGQIFNFLTGRATLRFFTGRAIALHCFINNWREVLLKLLRTALVSQQ